MWKIQYLLSCSISSFSIFPTASVKSVSSLESCGNGLADEELLEAAEIPLDGRVFLSVSVPSTEVHTEPGGSQYTLYTIQVNFPCQWLFAGWNIQSFYQLVYTVS